MLRFRPVQSQVIFTEMRSALDLTGFLPAGPISVWRGQVAAVGFTVPMVLLRVALNPVLGHSLPFSPFALSVVVAALYGGYWAGMTAIFWCDRL